ncbi:hypothetical protein L3Q82_004262 [Scortum barcoo]|uniref:Uncharacterized protein n=1 Tax=Scortum barcoo TaxID=214431 RepID=A0ACB8VJ38_9TELE|nr:hypothetical protein L3Q82_004262 [Scortum barcoo]
MWHSGILSLYYVQPKKFNLPKTAMVHFDTAIVKFILASSITIRYAATAAKDKGRLQRIIRSAEKVIGCNLPPLQDLDASRPPKRAAMTQPSLESTEVCQGAFRKHVNE